MVQWLRLYVPNARGMGSIPGQGTRYQMLKLRVFMPHLKILHAATKTQHSQINTYFKCNKGCGCQSETTRIDGIKTCLATEIQNWCKELVLVEAAFRFLFLLCGIYRLGQKTVEFVNTCSKMFLISSKLLYTCQLKKKCTTLKLRVMFYSVNIQRT